MAIETEITVTLVEVEVSDVYQVEVTVHDPLTHQTATVSLDWDQTLTLIDDLTKARAAAESLLWEDRGRTAGHGFDGVTA